MKTVTVRLPERLAAQLKAESRHRGVSKSKIIRERLERDGGGTTDLFATIADLVGSVDGLPTNLSAKKKAYLRSSSYGSKRAR
jgi:hypothetical protein